MGTELSGPTVLRPGSRHGAVLELRRRLHELGFLATADSDAPEGRAGSADLFDAAVERAVRAFQQVRGVTADGVVGATTLRALDEAGRQLGERVLAHHPGELLAGDDVVALQQRLLDLGFRVGRIDGRFGPDTEQAVREFQRNVGIQPDGTCGPATLQALDRLAPIVGGGSPNAMRSEELIRRAGPSLAGKVVVVDAAASQARDPQLRQLADAATSDLAQRVESRLLAAGVQAHLSTAGVGAPDDEAARAELANGVGANLCVSLQVDASSNPRTSGVASYYYGLEAHQVRSWVGERFAGLVQREIVARTGLTDLRGHPRSWDILRRTRMPAVRVEVGYVTNDEDAAKLADPAFRNVVAEAVVVAVQRLYLAPESDPRTGFLRIDEINRLRQAAEAGQREGG